MPHAYRDGAIQGTGKVPEDAAIREIRGMVSVVVWRLREHGVRLGIAGAAELLGLGERRTRGYYHGEIRAVPEGELDRCRAVFAKFQRQHLYELGREMEAIQQYLDRNAAWLQVAAGPMPTVSTWAPGG